MIVATGIGSGLDIESLVTQLVESERTPTETRLFNSELNLTSSISALGSFKSALSSLEGAISGLDSADIFKNRSSSSTDNSVVFASADEDAVEASYKLEVTQLAQAHSLASTAFDSLSDEVGEGTLTIRFGTTDYTGPDPGPESYDGFTLNPDTDIATITIDSTNNSLEGLRDEINDADIGVSATIINDGSGYRMLLSSIATGEELSMEISVDDTGDSDNADDSGLSRFSFSATAVNLEQTSEGLDASLSVNGIAITSSSNEVTEVIEGVTFYINDLSESEETISISHDVGAAVSAIQSLVSNYNSFLDTVDAVAGYDAETETSGVLQGDFTVRSVATQVRQMLTDELDDSVGEFTHLSQIGIRSETDGRLSFDQSYFNDAYEENAEDVIGLFTSIGVPSHTSVTYADAEADTLAGTYDVEITTAASQATLTGSVVGFPLTIDSSNDNFVIALNEEQSGTLSLTHGTYTDSSELTAEMQSRINGDSDLSENGLRVVVEINSSSGAIEIKSEEYGAENLLELISADTGFISDLGFATQTQVEGEDVAGRIDGVTAEGSGQTLTGAEGSDAEGLQLIIDYNTTGSLGSVAYSSGIADKINSLIGLYLDSDGILDSRIDSYELQIEDIESQREQLDARLESLEARYRSQFNALDAMLASLQTTSDYLTQQLESLPGPRTSSS